MREKLMKSMPSDRSVCARKKRDEKNLALVILIQTFMKLSQEMLSSLPKTH
mgnify:CR=1 FL=1